MLRWLLIALVVFAVLRLIARLASARIPSAGMPAPRDPPKPTLSAAERAELERERETALREGRQIDAIKIHRQLTGLGLKDAKDEVDELRKRSGGH
jgi:ribosomal protein L7/L12